MDDAIKNFLGLFFWGGGEGRLENKERRKVIWKRNLAISQNNKKNINRKKDRPVFGASNLSPMTQVPEYFFF